MVAANASAIADLRNEVDESIAQRIKPTEDKLREVDGQVQVLHKTVSVFESRHVETTERIKEVTVLTNNLQGQMKDQEQKMAEQSTNDLNRINNRLQDVENQSGLSDQKIQELDAGHQ